MSTPGNLPQCKILSPNTRDNDGNSFMAELENTTYLMHSVLFMGFCYPKQCVEKDSESKSELSKKRVPSGGGGGGACSILVPQPDIEPAPPTVEAQNLNH